MSVSGNQMNNAELVEKEVYSCLTDVVVAISETAKDWDQFKRRSYNHDAQRTSMLPDWEEYKGTLVRSPDVLSYHYDKCVKEKKIEEEVAIYREEGPVMSGQCCESCGENHIDVLARGEGGVDSLSVHAPFISTENMLWGRRPPETCGTSIVCQSCIQGFEDPDIVEDGYAERCSACGISNILCCDEDIIEDHFIYHNYRDLGLCGFCRSCDERLFPGEKEELLYDRRERLSIPHHNTFVVSDLEPRVLEYPDSEDDLDLTDDEGLAGGSQEWEEEYENEELPENNSEKAKEIKDAVRQAGEKVFDLKDTLREGDYLELMDLLQEITNRVNTL